MNLFYKDKNKLRDSIYKNRIRGGFLILFFILVTSLLVVLLASFYLKENI